MAYTLINGTVIDGTGAPPVAATVVVEGERIGPVGPGVPPRGEIVDARGLVVAPGFVDSHSHADLAIIAQPILELKLRQGVTLDVVGQDGMSMAPVGRDATAAWRAQLAPLTGDPLPAWDWTGFGEYLRRLDGRSLNVASLVGHGNLRVLAIGMDDRAPAPAELRRMRDELDLALGEGAIGLSTGLIYPPAVYSTTDELVALGEVVAGHRSVLVAHLRYEGEQVVDGGMAELFEIARRSGCAVHISHFKSWGRGAWGLSGRMLAALDRARAEGIDVTADQYPYTAGSTMLGALLPPRAHARGPEGVKAALRDGATRAELAAEIERDQPGWESMARAAGWENIRIAGVRTAANRATVGRDLRAVAADWAVSPFDAVARLLLEEDLAVSMIIFAIDEADVERIIAHPRVMTGSDGLMGGTPHPRTWGTMPRVLGHYVRERGIESLPEAVRKMTSLPCARLGIADRGVVREGAWADLCLFDPARVRDRATYDAPTLPPEGVEYVFVNGRPAVWQGAIRPDARAVGRALRREAVRV